MAEYHVGCGAFAIYAGTLNSKNKSLWQNKFKSKWEINPYREATEAWNRRADNG